MVFSLLFFFAKLFVVILIRLRGKAKLSSTYLFKLSLILYTLF
jgi:hypothetical protein